MSQIEYGDLRDGRHIRSAVLNAPEWARRKVNEIRARRGLPAIVAEPEPQAVEPKVWRRCADGTYLEAKEWLRRFGKQSGPPSGSRREAGRAAPPAKRYGVRVVAVCCPGQAPGRHIGDQLPEEFSGRAFAADLDTYNRYGGWYLEDGHGGPKLAEGGSGELRAHVVEKQLVIEWLPDLSNRRHAAVVERIEAGCAGVSIAFKTVRSEIMPFINPGPRDPRFVRTVLEARLTAVALLSRSDIPAYPFAMSKVFRNATLADGQQLGEQIRSVIKTAQSRERRARGWSAD